MPEEQLMFIPPSQQSAQGPVPKPGEPVRPTKGIQAVPPEGGAKPDQSLPVPSKAPLKKVP